VDDGHIPLLSVVSTFVPVEQMDSVVQEIQAVDVENWPQEGPEDLLAVQVLEEPVEVEVVLNCFAKALTTCLECRHQKKMAC